MNTRQPQGEPVKTEQPASDRSPGAQTLVLGSADLFAGTREVWIEHNGQLYRLQVTKAGKLILTK